MEADSIEKTLKLLHHELRVTKKEIRNLQKKCAMQERFRKQVLEQFQPLSKTKRMKKQFANIECNDDILQALSGSENLHDEVIRDNLPSMVDAIELKNTLLLDQLIEDDCLTSDEGSHIRHAGNRQDQTRKLCKIMSKRSSKTFEIFLKRLSEHDNYPPIAETLKTSYDKKKQKYFEGLNRVKSCVACSIMEKVEIKDVFDVLLQGRVVEWDFLDKMNKFDNRELWSFIFERMQYADDIMDSVKFLRSALGKKHPEIASLLPKQPQFYYQIKCYCKQLGRKEQNTAQSTLPSYSDVFSSTGYVKTTTEEREKSLGVDEFSDRMTNTSSKVLPKSNKKCSDKKEGDLNTKINEWLECKDEKYDQDFPDPEVNENCCLPFDPSVETVNQDDNSNTQYPNLEEVAVEFLSKNDQIQGAKGSQQSCNKGFQEKKSVQFKSTKSERKRKTNNSRVGASCSSDTTSVKNDGSGMPSDQSHQFQPRDAVAFNLLFEDCKVDPNNDRVVDSDMKSDIMFDIFQKDNFDQSQCNENKVKDKKLIADKKLSERMDKSNGNERINSENKTRHSLTRTTCNKKHRKTHNKKKH